MPGMNSGLSPSDPTLVAAFRSALLHQGAVALIAIVFLWLIWATARTWRLTAPAAKDGTGGTGAGTVGWRAGGPGWAKRVSGAARSAGAAEAPGRRLLRVGFGLLWIFDGILQAQPKMAGGLATQVIQPTAAASPAWVQHLVNWGGTAWSYHPIQAGAASVWIQVGIGAWLIVVVPRLPGPGSPGAASVGWGLIVWVFGESFGGIFAPGLSWLTGAPGAVLLYVVAGALIALPEGAWRSPRLGRLLLAGARAVLRSGWPCSRPGPAAVSGRARWTASPGPCPGWCRRCRAPRSRASFPRCSPRFGSFTARHGFAVNLVVVIILAALGATFLTGRARLVRYAVWFGIVFCLADWVLVQDFGFLGGLGTDPNSMIPLVLLFSAGYLALAPATVKSD